MIEIPVLVTSAWTMLQPYLPVLAAKAAEEAGKKVPEAAIKVWEMVKSKFASNPAAQKALEQVANEPDDPDLQGQFRAQLKTLLKEDAAFMTGLSAILEKSGSDFKGQVIGDGAIAQGPGAKAVGAGGILVEGNVDGGITIGKK